MEKQPLVSLEVGETIEVEGEVFQIQEALLTGGQAFIYRATNKSGMPFAVKEYFPQRGGYRDTNGVICVDDDLKDEWEAQRKKITEAQELAAVFSRLCHQSQYLPYKTDRESRVEVIKFNTKDCKTLADLLERWEEDNPVDTWRLEKALTIGGSILNALNVLHSDDEEESWKGCAHCDLTPTNLFVTDDGSDVAYPVDFGCCTPFGKKVISFSRGYNKRHRNTACPQTDLYSVAALMLIICAGIERSTDQTEGMVVKDLSRSNIRTIVNSLALPFGVREKLKAIILKAARVRNAYPSAREMLADIRILRQIYYGKGVHRETLMCGSELVCDSVAKMDFDPELVVEVVCKQEKMPDPGWENSNPEGLPTIETYIDKGHSVVVAEGGSGKTTKIKLLHKQLFERLKADPDGAIPLYVDLTDFDGSEFYIRDYLIKKYSKIDIGFETLRTRLERILSENSYVLLLDGLDMAKDSEKLEMEIDLLSRIDTVKICIAARYVPNDWLCIKNNFCIFTALPLADALVCRKLDEAGRHISVLNRVYDVLKRPMFLQAYLNGTENADTPGEILYNDLKARSENKVGKRNRLLAEYALYCALPLLSDFYSFSYDTAKEILEGEPLDAFRSLTGQMKQVFSNGYTLQTLQALLEMGVLESPKKNVYKFSHQNYYELFRADYMIKAKTFNPWTRLSFTCIGFVGDLLGNQAELYFNEIISKINDPLAEQRMTGLMIDAVRISRGNRMGVCFDERNLTTAILEHADLTGSSFYQTVIPDATLAQYGHKKAPDGFCVTPNSSLVVTWEAEEKLIFVWDYNREEPLVCVLRSPIIPLCVAISVDGKLLAVRDEDRLVIYQTTGEQKADFSLVGLVPEKAHYCDNRPILCFVEKFLLCNFNGQIIQLSLEGKVKHTYRFADLKKEEIICDFTVASKRIYFISNMGSVYMRSTKWFGMEYDYEGNRLPDDSIRIPLVSNNRIWLTRQNKIHEIWEDAGGELALVYGPTSIPGYCATGKFGCCYSLDMIDIYQLPLNADAEPEEMWIPGDIHLVCGLDERLFVITQDRQLLICDLVNQKLLNQIRIGTIVSRYKVTGCAAGDEGGALMLLDYSRPQLLANSKIQSLPGMDMRYNRTDGEYYLHESGFGYVEITSLKTVKTEKTAYFEEFTATRRSRQIKYAKYLPERDSVLVVDEWGEIKLCSVNLKTWIELPIDIPFDIDEAQIACLGDRFLVADNGRGTVTVFDIDGEYIKKEVFDPLHERIDNLVAIPNSDYCLAYQRVAIGSEWDWQYKVRVLETNGYRFLETDKKDTFIDQILQPNQILCFEEPSQTHPLKALPFLKNHKFDTIQLASGKLTLTTNICASAEVVVLVNADGSVTAYCPKTGNPIRHIPFSEMQATVKAMRLSPSGDTLCVHFVDDSVGVYGVYDKSYDKKWRMLLPLNVCGCDFRGAKMSESLKNLLKMYGAVVDENCTN